ncbi:MAG: terminase family protein [Alphaproteobacteria bacterium]|nr:terminase family protein [Alphaproteobacteria bacterium]
MQRTGSERDSTASKVARRKAELLAEISDREALCLLYDWEFWRRPSQTPPPGDWRIWLIRAGRGFGKTRVGAEWVRARIEAGRADRVALVGETATDVRDVMVEGESGLLSVCPPWFKPVWEPSKRRLTWPNGAIATGYSADDPEQLRGPQHDAAWADEAAKWRYEAAWDNLLMGLRLGRDPRCVMTTTPRPRAWLKKLAGDKGTAVTTGSTFENSANLADGFMEAILSRYEGTRLGRQELYGEVLEDVPGALWTLAGIDATRVPHAPGDLRRIVVAVDPSGTGGEGGDEIGIVVAGRGVDGDAYVLGDRSCRLSPAGWGHRVVEAARDFRADRIVAERTYGGAMVEHVIRTVDRSAAIDLVDARRGKVTRAEPVAALYEQGRVHHAGGFPELESQMSAVTRAGYVGAGSPDRVDALVWALTALMLDDRGPTGKGRLKGAF